MNKLMGFFELRDSGLPSVPWKIFDEDSKMDKDYLWTVRTAVDKGEDTNLPRIVGKNSDEAYLGAIKLYEYYKNKGMIVYYPYFIADKSGVVDVNNDRVVIEAVEKDLWNFVTNGNKNVTIILGKDKNSYDGDSNFLSNDEINLLIKNINIIKHKYRDNINEGYSMVAEWSFAYNTDINKKATGDKYLVFYELRSI